MKIHYKIVKSDNEADEKPYELFIWFNDEWKEADDFPGLKPYYSNKEQCLEDLMKFFKSFDNSCESDNVSYGELDI